MSRLGGRLDGGYGRSTGNKSPIPSSTAGEVVVYLGAVKVRILLLVNCFAVISEIARVSLGEDHPASNQERKQNERVHRVKINNDCDNKPP